MMNKHNSNFAFYIRGQFMGGIEDIPPGAPNRLPEFPRSRVGLTRPLGQPRLKRIAMVWDASIPVA